MDRLIVGLNALNDPDFDRELVGAKALHLNQLHQAGLPVPQGFVITTEAYQAYVAANGLNEQIGNAQRVGTARGLEKHFLRGILPQDLERAILAVWNAIAKDSSYAAVRSSATSEDLEDASFAGQYESILSVDSEADLLLAIKRCWASLWSERALLYRQSHDHSLKPKRPLMAVIVQQQVSPEVSGVLFTLSPTATREEEMMVEAVWGLGEGLVSGLVTPDRYVIDTWKEQVKRREVADKRIMITPLGRENVSEERRAQSCLNDEQLLELAHLGSEVQLVYGYPQDIEWALQEGRFHILQTRPLTRFTFAPDIGQWTCVNLQEVLPGFVSVISQSLSHTHGWDPTMQELFLRLKMMSEPRDDIRWTRLFFGRAYWNAGIVKEYNALLPGFNELAFDRTVGIPPSYEGEGRLTRFTPRSIWRGLPVLLALNRAYKEVWEEARAYCEGFYRRKESDLDRVDPKELNDQEIREHVKRMMDLHCEANRIALLVTFLSTQSQDDFQRTVDDLNLSNADRQPIRVSKLLTGLSGVRTTRPLVGLWHLARKARSEPAVAEVIRETPLADMPQEMQSFQEGLVFWRDLKNYLKEFRYMAASDEDLSYPRWDEDPPPVLRTLKSFVSGQGDEDPEERIKAQVKIRLLEEKRALVRLTHGWNRLCFWRRRSFVNQLDLVKRFCWWREETRVVAAWAFYYCHKALLEQGRRWAAQGVLDETDDIFWMTKQHLTGLLDETMGAAEVREVVRKYRWTTIAYRNYDAPAVIVGRGGLERDRPIPTGKRFVGVPCGAGLAMGRAKVVLDLDEADRLEKGDILIVPYSNPGWTPLFSVAAGIIMEEGGLLSHGAVVARECGIPTVLQIAQATGVFRDGQLLRVDGDTGVVEIVGDG